MSRSSSPSSWCRKRRSGVDCTRHKARIEPVEVSLVGLPTVHEADHDTVVLTGAGIARHEDELAGGRAVAERRHLRRTVDEVVLEDRVVHQVDVAAGILHRTDAEAEA